MRDTISHHTEPLYALPRHYFPPVGPSQRNKRRLNPNHHVYRPALNISGLVDALQVPISNALESRTSPRKGKGTKRVASPAPSGTGRTKRMKRESPEAKSGHDEKKLTEFTWAEMQYPKLKALVPDSARDAGVEIPIMAHTFEMTYSNEIPSGSILGLYAGGDEYEEWPSDEKNLVDALQVLASVMDHDEQEIDLGNALLCSHSSRVVAVSQVLAKREGSIDWFLLLPRAADGLDLELLGLPDDGLAETHDVLLQCVKLMQEKRVTIDAKLRLRMRAAEDTILPFSLSLHVTVSLTPRAFGTDGSKSTVETMQRQLIQHVYPDPLVHTGNEDPTVPFFYSVVGPAPPVATREAENALQPAGLVATLLPFQRRSVAWLLAREGKMVTDDGEIINKPSATQPGFSFWSRIQEGSYVFYVHRITGQLSLTAPEEEEGLGGMLAEEPGLGKTLEIISLLLLNPAGPERHPGNKRWDAEASIEVKTVKTTLIVTPPTLAPQWMDELRTHAPSLKVLLYEGWNKVDVPLTRAELDKARAKSQISKQRKGKGRARDWDEDADAMDVDTEVLDWASFVQGYDVVVTTYATLSRDVNVARAARQRPRREDVVYAATIERARSPLIMTEWLRVVMDEVQMVGGGQVEDMVSMIPRVSSFAVSGTPARTQVADLIHVLRFLRVDHLLGYSARHWQRLVCAGYSEYFRRFFQGIAVRTTKASIKTELTIPQQTRYLVGIEMGRVERHVYDRNLESILLELGLDARGVDVRGEQRTPDPVILRSLLRKLRAICTHPQIGQLGVNKIFKPSSRTGGPRSDCCFRTCPRLTRGRPDPKSRSDCPAPTAWNRTQSLPAGPADFVTRRDGDQMMLDEIRGVLAAHETTSPAQRSASPSALSEAESEEEDDSKIDIKTKAYRSKRNALKQRLREAQLVHHRVKFLQGDVCHMLGPSHLDAENAAMKRPKTEKDARESMKLLEDSGARSEWRGQLTGLLMTGLTPDEQADGQEYQRTLDDQGEAEIYLTNYTALLADYREKEKKLRETKAAMKATARDENEKTPEVATGIELQPEHEVLHTELASQRKRRYRLSGSAIRVYT
ncbi:unnamed protein product [Mycena citricolor]|uniref:Helicase ATP-binding domain-containing protein n=1 Tax=Mycena citricolor TaxID=2018698 RepID=A0AAD2H3Z3_9AGAR|nr:unnamed protein product [Mycena citricolor]